MKIRLGKYGIAFYTESWVARIFGLDPDDGGTAWGPLVFIRPKYWKTDEGIFQHEMLHTRQWWTLKEFTMSHLEREVACYRLQLEYPPATENRLKYELLFSSYLAHDYEFSDKINQEEALKLLRG